MFKDNPLAKKIFLLFSIFIFMALAFSFLRVPIGNANRWLLSLTGEGIQGKIKKPEAATSTASAVKQASTPTASSSTATANTSSATDSQKK